MYPLQFITLHLFHIILLLFQFEVCLTFENASVIDTNIRIDPNQGPQSGGTSLLIHGIFENYQQNRFSCVFHHVVVDAKTLSETEIECLTPPSIITHGDIELQIRRNENVIGKGIYTYYPDPLIVSFFPQLVPITGGASRISVKMSHIQPTNNIVCKFGMVTTKGTIASPDIAICPVPQGQSIGKVDLSISLNGGHDYSLPVLNSFAFIRMPFIDAISPLYLSTLENVTLYIYGTGFDAIRDVGKITCQTDDGLMTAVIQRDDELTCLLPPTDTYSDKRLMIYLSLGDNVYNLHVSLLIYHQKDVSNDSSSSMRETSTTTTTTTTTFNWYHKSSIEYVEDFDYSNMRNITSEYIKHHLQEPENEFESLKFSVSNVSYAPNEKKIFVYGTNFVSTVWFCNVDSQIVLAHTLNQHELSCDIPSHIRESNISIQVCSRHSQCSEKFSLYLINRIQVNSVSHNVGFVDRATTLWFGMNQTVHENAKCRFKGIETPISYDVSTNIFSCEAPVATKLGSVDVHLSLDGKHFFPSSIRFVYISRPFIISIDPDILPFDSKLKSVHVFGERFLSGHEISCVYIHERMNITQYAIWISDTEVICPLKSLKQGKWNLTLSYYGDAELAAQNSLELSVINPTSISSVSPSRAPPGSTITLCGTSLTLENKNGTCFFDHMRVPASPLSEFCVTCKVPFVHSDRNVSISYSVDTSSHVWFDMKFEIKSASLASASPNLIDVSRRNVTIAVLGKGLMTLSSQTFCSVGDTKSTGFQIISDDRVDCTFQSFKDIGFQHLVLETGYLKLFGDAYIHVLPTATLSRSSKTILVEGLEEMVEVTGNNFHHDNFTCYLDDLPSSRAIVASSQFAFCLMPPCRQGLRKFYISNDGNKNDLYHKTFECIPRITIASLHPTIGMIGTIVEVKGIHFRNDMICQFGDLDEPMIFINNTFAQCRAPIHTKKENTTVPFRVLFNDQDISLSTETFFFSYIDLAIDSIVPSHGVIGESTLITVHLAKGSSRFVSYCKLGINLVQATILSDSSVVCEMPILNEFAIIPIELSSNGIDATSDGFSFHTTDVPIIQGFSPNFGLENGGTRLVIDVSKFPRSRDAICKFNDLMTSPIHWISMNQISCITPVLKPGNYSLHISTNGLNAFQTENLASRFEVKPLSSLNISESVNQDTNPIVISKEINSINTNREKRFPSQKKHIIAKIDNIYPLRGLIYNAHVIQIVGTGFDALKHQLCLIGTRVIDALFINSTRLECDVPSVATPETFDINVSQGGRIIKTSGISFRFSFVDLSISGNQRVLNGEATEGLIVSLAEETAPYVSHCWFDETSVQAILIDKAKISCQIPEIKINIGARLELSVTGNDATSSFSFYRPQKTHRITDLNRNMLSGGKSLVLTGENFVRSKNSFCIFSDNYHSLALWISGTEILCQSSPYTPGMYEVGLSLNGLKVSLKQKELIVQPNAVPSYAIVENEHAGLFIGIYGSYFIPESDVFCILDSSWIKGSVAHSKLIVCPMKKTIRSSQIESFTLNIDDIQYRIPLYLSEDDYQRLSLEFEEEMDAETINHDLQEDLNDPLLDFREPLIVSFSPMYGVKHGGTTVSFFGYNLHRLEEPICYFGSVPVKPVYHDEKIINYLTPSMFEESNVTISILDEKSMFEWSSNPIYFHIVNIPRVDLIRSEFHRIVVIGQNLAISNELWMRFIETPEMEDEVAAVFLNETHAFFERKSLNQVDLVDISINRLDWITNLTVHNQEQINVISIQPNFASTEGNVMIQIQLSPNNLEISNFKCCFGSTCTVQSKIISSTELKCKSPAVSVIGKVPFRLSIGGEIQIQTDHMFEFTPPCIFRFIEPTVASHVGGDLINFYVDGLQMNIDYFCRFGSIDVLGKLMGKSILVCEAPESAKMRVSVRVFNSITNEFCLNGFDNVEMQYLRPFSVYEVTPTVMQVNQNLKFSVGGLFFDQNVPIECNLGSQKVPAHVLTDRLVECEFQGTNETGLQDFFVSSSKCSICESNFKKVRIVHAPVITSIHPSELIIGRSRAIEISGFNFDPYVNYLCEFENFTSRVVAVWIHDEKLSCTTPTLTSQVAFQMHLIISDGHVKSNAALVAVKYPLQPLIIRNSSAFRGRSASVRAKVFGLSAKERYIFSIGNYRVDADVSDDNVLEVKGDFIPFELGVLHVYLFDRYEMLLVGMVSVAELPSIDDISPREIFINSNASILQISGRNLSGIGFIRFTLVDEQIFLDSVCTSPSDLSLSCQIPIFTVDGTYRTSFSVDGENFAQSSSGISVVERPIVFDFNPRFGFANGGTKVSIYGASFRGLSKLRCKFGSKYVDAVFQSDEEISCLQPMLYLGFHTIQIGINDYDFVVIPSLYLSFSPLRLLSIEPSFGPPVGGTNVIMKFSSLGSLMNQTLECIFGAIKVIGKVIDSSSVSCLSPSVMMEQSVFVFLAGNGISVIENGTEAAFHFVEQPSVVNIIPKIGSISGGTPIKVFTQNIHLDLFENVTCHLGEDFIVTPLSVTKDYVECASSVPLMNKREHRVAIHYGNSQVAPNTGFIFNYIEPIQIYSIYPAVGSVFKETLITVEGSFIPSSTHLRCLLGNTTSFANVMNSKVLQCMAPAQPLAQRLPLFIISDGHEILSENPNEAFFEYTLPHEVHSIHPTYGSYEGSTSVIVQGSKFSENSELSCHFGLISVPAVFINTEKIKCSSPPFITVGRNDTVSFKVCSDGDECAGENYIYYKYIPAPRIIQIDPLHGPLGGGTVVHVQLSLKNATPIEEIVCNFGNITVNGMISKYAHEQYLLSMHCKSPPSDIAGDVHFEIRVDQNSGSIRTLSQFRYHKQIHLNRFYPQEGFAFNEVRVEGEHFGKNGDIECLFGNQRSPLTKVISSTEILCIQPPSDVNLIVELKIQIGGDLLSFEKDVAFYRMQSRPIVDKINRNTLKVDGSDTVEIIGRNLNGASHCFFGQFAKPSMVIERTNRSITCHVSKLEPSSMYAGTEVELYLSFKSEMFAMNITVSYENHLSIDSALSDSVVKRVLYPNIESIRPKIVSSLGGTMLNITGSNFLNRRGISCSFGDSFIVPAKYISINNILCLTPQMIPGLTTIRVQNGGEVAELSKKSAIINVVLDVSIVKLFPDFGYLTGGTLVEITVVAPHSVGKEFNRSNVICRFGNLDTIAADVDDTSVMCLSPPVVSPEVVTVKLSFDGGASFSASHFSFAYYDVPQITRISPVAGPLQGGISIAVEGTNFVHHDGVISCRFTPVGTTRGVRVSHNVIVCISPEHKESKDVDIEISFNGQDFIQSLNQFKYFEPIQILLIHPTSSPSLVNGNEIYVLLKHVLKSTLYYCNFGLLRVQATILSNNELICESPAVETSTVDFSVSSQGCADIQCRSNLMEFKFVSSPTIVFNKSTLDSFPVIIRGFGFSSSASMLCRFKGRVSPLLFIKKSLTTCSIFSEFKECIGSLDIFPQHVRNRPKKSEVAVTLEKCPLKFSYIVPNGTMVDKNSPSKWTLCAPGTFAPQISMQRCLPCPVGFICPDFGLSKPLICPPGKICDTSGLSLPITPCPKGHYCLAGTKTSSNMLDDTAHTWKVNEETGLYLLNHSALNLKPSVRHRPALGSYRTQFGSVAIELNAEQPIACPLGYFCVDGVGSNSSILNNYSTPQPCFEGYFCPRGSTSAEGSGPCPTGHFCPSHSQAIACPVSHYCPGVGNTYPKACLPGTYSNTTGQSYCSLCKIGYMCPGTGQRIPSKCSAGYVCDSEGLSLPTKLCPPGYYCEEGTQTADPYDLNHQFRPLPCPAGVFCLGGIAHNRTMEWLPSNPIGKLAPQLCAEGYYCGEVSKHPSGYGMCFPGHYCPPGTSWPVPVPIGSFSGSKAIAPSICAPGSYAPSQGLRDCIPCPAGYSCEGYGTSVPKSCNEGTYRSVANAISCQLCPTGTYTPYRGSTDISECFPCPQGRICSSKAMFQVAESEPCGVGYVCSSAMDSSNGHKVTCASGHFCPPQTTVQNQFDFACGSGYFCNRGTSSPLRFQGRCQEKYFCPIGTPESISPLTQCPRQTISTSTSRDANNCTVRMVEVCDKSVFNPLDPSETSSYYELSSSNLYNQYSVGFNEFSTKELSVVKKIRPVINEKSIKWHNDTVEVFRVCSDFLFVSSGADRMQKNRTAVTLIGRNFANETSLTCRFRTFSKDGGLHFSKSTDAVFFSSTHIGCSVPDISVSSYNTQENYDFCVLDNDRKLYFRRPCTSDDDESCVGSFLIPGDRHRRYYSLFIPCLDEDINDMTCSNIPTPGFQVNPCYSIEVMVDSSNDGLKYSGDKTDIYFTEDSSLMQSSQKKSYQIPSTNAILTVIDPSLAADNFANSSYFDNELVQIHTKACLRVNEREVGDKSYEGGWFKLEYMEQAHLLIDWRYIPETMVFGRDFTLAIYNIPSRCNIKMCQEDLFQQNVEDLETVPCEKPIQLPESFTQSLVYKNQLLNLTVFALDDVLFKVEIHILNGLFLPSSNLLSNSIHINVSGPKRAKFLENDKKNIMMRPLSQYLSWIEREVPMAYIFAVKLTPENTRSIAPPYNLPPRWSDFEKGRVLLTTNVSSVDHVLSGSKTRNEPSTMFWKNPFSSALAAKEQTDLYFETFHGMKVNSKGEYDYEMSSMLLSYLPFLSKCTSYDSYIQLSHVLESNKCSLPTPSITYPTQWWRRDYQALPHPDHISPIGPFDFKQFYPIADWCEQSFECAFEEELDKAQLIPRWFEASNGTTLFSVVRDPVSYFQYTGRTGFRTSSDDGGGKTFVESIDLDDVFIPVKVKSIKDQCDFPCIPRSVTIEIAYHQVNTTSKQIVNIDLVLREFDGDSMNSQYKLDIKFFPLNYQELVVQFAFPRDVFRLLFVVIGMMTVVSSVVYWFLVRLTTQVENPPHLRFLSTLLLLVPQALIGFVLGMIPIISMTLAVVMIVDGNILVFSTNDSAFERIPSHYSASSIDPELAGTTRQGRLGLAFCSIAIICMFQSSKALIPDRSRRFVAKSKDNNDDTSSGSRILNWKRSNFVIMSVFMALFLVAVIEWSFWPSFGKYIWGAIIFLKILNIFISRLVDNQVGELLLSAPLMAAFGLVETIITLSAVDFIDFLLSYMVGFGFLLIERMYISPFMGDWFVWVGQCLTMARDLITRRLRRDTSSKSKINDIKSTSTVEPIIESYTGYCMETLSLLYVPYIILFLTYFRDETELPKIYGITEQNMAYYATFAIIIIPFQLLADVFLIKAMELFHGWKIYEYLLFARYRFSQRETKWRGNEDSLDECIDTAVRSIDHMCFSSQFYFMMTIHVNSIIYLVIGIEMMNRASYNLFGDPVTPIILCKSFLVVLILKFGFVWSSVVFNVWGIRKDKTQWHSGMIAADSFKIPDLSELRDASHEAFEMNKLISNDTFRYKFVNYNRSWLIEQLPNLLTPRTLRRSKPFLLNQLARAMHNLNHDISSDEEDSGDDVFKNAPNLSTDARVLLKDWVAKAQSRVMYTQCVQHLVERAKSSHCEWCLGTKALKVECNISLDELIIAFEKRHPGNPVDHSLWKQFWFNHQKYKTICVPCKSKKMKDDTRKFEVSKDLLLDPKTCEISKKWLLWARKNVRTTAHIDVSDDSSSEDEPYWKSADTIELGRTSSALAILWLKRARRHILLTREEMEK